MPAERRQRMGPSRVEAIDVEMPARPSFRWLWDEENVAAKKHLAEVPEHFLTCVRIPGGQLCERRPIRRVDKGGSLTIPVLGV